MARPHPLIAKLDLQRHPEGGWYRETIRLPGSPGERDVATAILFLLEGGQRSHWHRVDADELWLWHAGSPLALMIDLEEHRLGGDPLEGQAPQLLVPCGAWQAAEAREGWALVSCVVTPGFDFAGFELAAPGWSPS
ncbi:cupin domain-containing protein [Sphingomonas sp. AR_OL41]|uniref:cupin domain-containing protein n=1 Tax=Sphingomonas sp. AR_OL41 TaxID=3042729 RepID=UPI00248067CF|nr:cupin domain-containing protein [Sphingomonas sp. AR_OL41]MDH7973124.1 cupin domain-containing protein [Sphingomonas sp. AR_OL41]